MKIPIKVWLLVHGGYDFQPTTLAVCLTEERAEAMKAEHYSQPGNQDFPWNGCWVEEVPLEEFISWPGVRSGPFDGEDEDGRGRSK